jgi:sulfite exporter TauE/SafE
MLALSAASGSPARGALVMAAFGLGTLPTLLAAGYGAQRLLAFRRVPWIRQSAGALIIAMALVGFWRIPHLQEMVLAGWHCLV